MTVLEEEVARLMHEATDRALSDAGKAAATAIVHAVPFAGGVVEESEAGHWVSLNYPPEIELHVSLDVDDEIDFDFDRGSRPNRFMLSIVAMRTGGIIYSLMTPTRKEHGGFSREHALARLTPLFQYFTEG